MATLAPRTRLARGNASPPRSRAHDPRDLYGIVPADTRTPYDVREVIARLVDGSRFLEFKAEYGATLVTGFAHLHGHPVGIVANNGILFSESALKGAHFIELCDRRRIPLVFLQNISGFMVGKAYEAGRHRQARRQDGHRRRLRPGAEVHRGHRRLVRRGQLRDGRAGVLAPVPVDVAERPHLGDGRRAGRERALHGRQRRSRRHPQRSTSDQGNPYYSTARLWDDGVIDPLDTRTVLGLALSAAANAPLDPVGYGVFRM